jgi:CRISPR-associated protein Csm2
MREPRAQAKEEDRPKLSREDYVAIIERGDAQRLVGQAEAIGKYLAKVKFPTSQIRGIFGTVRRIEMNWDEGMPPDKQLWAQRELLLLKPKLAYQAARHKKQTGGQGMDLLKDVLSDAIERVGEDRERFRHFVDFFEAILAYHRAYGGD